MNFMLVAVLPSGPSTNPMRSPEMPLSENPSPRCGSISNGAPPSWENTKDCERHVVEPSPGPHCAGQASPRGCEACVPFTWATGLLL